MEKEVIEEVTEELVEHTTEELVDSTEQVQEELTEEPKGKFFTDEELDKLIAKKVNRAVNKVEKKYATYKDTENVLNTALSTNNIEDANTKLREFYSNEGIKLPDKTAGMTDLDNERLAKIEADEIIEDGYDSMVQTANQLAGKKYENLNKREQVVFNTLVSKLNEMDTEKALLKLGASKELMKDEDFISFKNLFDRKTPIDKVYEMYSKQNKKTVKPAGSMKNADATKTKKDFYTQDEVSKLTAEDFEKDPNLLQVVRASMTSGKW